MKTVFKTAIAVAALFSASAASAGSDGPMPAAADWSGFYVGAMGGLDNGDISLPAIPGASAAFDTTRYGAFAGYNFQQGAIVYGAELAAQRGRVTATTGSGDLDYLVDARARLGYAMGDLMVYAAGGFSTGQISGGGTSDTATGWNAGAGVELAVTDNVFFGGEYIYRDLSGTVGGLFPLNFDYKSHGFQARIGYRF